jgi:hypothetical protein
MAEEKLEAQKSLAAALAAKEAAVQDAIKLAQKNVDARMEAEKQKVNLCLAEAQKKADAQLFAERQKAIEKSKHLSSATQELHSIMLYLTDCVIGNAFSALSQNDAKEHHLIYARRTRLDCIIDATNRAQERLKAAIQEINT